MGLDYKDDITSLLDLVNDVIDKKLKMAGDLSTNLRGNKRKLNIFI